MGGKLAFPKRDMPSAATVDLAGGYVVPPFCEGHNHNIGGTADNVEETVKQYLEDGVFYAMMPGSFALYRGQIASKINAPFSVDVAFANNGLTGPGGHPRSLRETLKERFGLYPEFSRSALADAGYFEVADRGELQRKWAMIRAERPDFVKVMLYHSEEFDARKDDPAFYGRRGIDPKLLPELVELAHRERLRVAVHVESEADLVSALNAGADIIAHLPSYDSATILSDETIALAVRKRAALVTTFSLATRYEKREPERYAAIRSTQKANLARLARAGAWLVVGSDNTRDTSAKEALHIAGLGALSNRKLLDMWTVDCARMVFPDRKIGHLKDGYEASLVVLKGSPLADFGATKKIRMRMKDGRMIASAEPPGRD